jgi:hypothetical protein
MCWICPHTHTHTYIYSEVWQIFQETGNGWQNVLFLVLCFAFVQNFTQKKFWDKWMIVYTSSIWTNRSKGSKHDQTSFSQTWSIFSNKINPIALQQMQASLIWSQVVALYSPLAYYITSVGWILIFTRTIRFKFSTFYKIVDLLILGLETILKRTLNPKTSWLPNSRSLLGEDLSNPRPFLWNYLGVMHSKACWQQIFRKW